MKIILLLFTLCDLFAHRYTPETHTKWTRKTSVIYSTLKNLTKTGKNKTKLHHRVFLNTRTRDSYPTASPEGHGTTPSEKCLRWSDTRPLGAAMQLTVLRQPPKDISIPMNSGHPKRKESNVPDPRNPTTPGDKDTAHSIAGITNRGNHNGVQYDLTVPQTLTCISLSPVTPYVNVSPLSHSDSLHNLRRTLKSMEMKEGPRHSAQGAGAAVRRHAPSREQHPTPSMTLHPSAYSPLRSNGSEEAWDGMEPL
jgi:hypothetical protein